MKRILYVGIDPPPSLKTENIVHCPLIKIVPRSHTDSFIRLAFENFETYTHLVFTSKSAVTLFFDFTIFFNIALKEVDLKTVFSVGRRTAAKLEDHGIYDSIIAQEETAEGIIQLFEINKLQASNIFLPQSSLARSVLCDWLKEHNIRHTACPIYDTVPNIPSILPNLLEFESITFTSPSTIDAFLIAYGYLPKNIPLNCIGPITKLHLHKLRTVKQ